MQYTSIKKFSKYQIKRGRPHWPLWGWTGAGGQEGKTKAAVQVGKGEAWALGQGENRGIQGQVQMAVG